MKNPLESLREINESLSEAQRKWSAGAAAATLAVSALTYVVIREPDWDTAYCDPPPAATLENIHEETPTVGPKKNITTYKAIVRQSSNNEGGSCNVKVVPIAPSTAKKLDHKFDQKDKTIGRLDKIIARDTSKNSPAYDE